MTEFITARYPDAEMPKTQTRAEMLERVHGFIRSGESARIREVGQEWTRWRHEADALDRIRAWVDKAGIGPKLVVQRERDREMLSIREITGTPDLGASPAVEEIHWLVWNEFPVRSGGLWLCRYIDGTRVVSRHGYQSPAWKGAAEDVFVLDGGMPRLVDVGRFIVARTKAGKADAATVIVDDEVWTPDRGWHVYGGARHYHVHFDVNAGSPCRP